MNQIKTQHQSRSIFTFLLIINILAWHSSFAQLERLGEAKKQWTFFNYVVQGDNGKYIGIFNIAPKETKYSIYEESFRWEKEIRQKKTFEHIGFTTDGQYLNHYKFNAPNKITCWRYEFSSDLSSSTEIKLDKFKQAKKAYVKFEYNDKSVYVFQHKGKSQSGFKYNIETGKQEGSYNFNVEGIKKNSLNVWQKTFFLKDGSIVTVVEHGDLGYKSRIIVYLFDKDLNLKDKYSYEKDIYINMEIGLRKTENSEKNNENIYLWEREVQKNKMTLVKFSFDGDEIQVNKNKIQFNEISMEFLTEGIDEKAYNSLFQQLVSNMAEDKYKEFPGENYMLGSPFVLGNETFINYNIKQDVKEGKKEGVVHMSGIFILDTFGKIVKNMVTEGHLAIDMKSPDEYRNVIHSLNGFKNGNNLMYVYVQDQEVKGFSLNETLQIKQMEALKFDNPYVRPAEYWEVSIIKVFERNQFLVRVGNHYQYFHYNYTLFKL